MAMWRNVVGIVLMWLLAVRVVVVVEGQLLHPIDMIALRSIKSSMHDLAGSNVLSTWVFALRVNPCQAFTGIQCVKVGSFNRVSSLALGPSGGTLPPSLAALAYLESLTIATGQLYGSIPDRIGNLANLKTLSLSPNFLTGQIPPSLANLSKLETLQLRSNQLKGQIPEGIGGLRSLRVLILSENWLYGPIPNLGQTSLIHLDVHNNGLSGGLPELPASVQYLSVTKNRMSGEVKELENLRQLTYLDLSFNEFSGSIPSVFFELPLSFLLLNHNEFRGAVSVPGLVTIPVVDLSHNHLQGSISPYLAGTQNLFLNHNLFIGTVPQDFANKMQESTLQSLYLQHNYLTNSGALGEASLPPSVAVCLQYNCMVPPPQSMCPPNVDMPAVRPGDQCVQAAATTTTFTGSPGD